MKYIDKGATISRCGKFRPRLWRRWDRSKPILTWIMLNPSTGDAEADDTTILKCVGFAMMWGYGGINIVNLYGFRATSPADLKAAGYPVGDDNERAHRDAIFSSKDTIVAWGTHARPQEVYRFLALWSREGLRPKCLGVNKDGSPKHPLYIAYETEPMTWECELA